MANQNTCLECSKPINGRSDKKFCDDGCRNTHNNRLNSENNVFVKRVNAVLKKNRKIIQSLLPEEEKITVSESNLKILGFNFEYFTHLYETKTGTTYHFCYEYGYLRLENNRFMLVKRQETKKA
jgi:hypothetical protein